jgi:hypothetical protein|tara:strand:- start:372 stop:539 length:168 start_codon:yes stop_codon:yes gene_type:complete
LEKDPCKKGQVLWEEKELRRGLASLKRGNHLMKWYAPIVQIKEFVAKVSRKLIET